MACLHDIAEPRADPDPAPELLSLAGVENSLATVRAAGRRIVTSRVTILTVAIVVCATAAAMASPLATTMVMTSSRMPEPASLVLFGSGLIFVARHLRKRRTRANG